MKLAWDTFVRFDAPDYTQEGIRNFKNFVNDEMLRKMFLAGYYQLFVAVDEGKCVGMLTLREKTHISLLFVDEKYHLHGVGSALIKFVSKYAVDEEGIDKLTVNASPYAVDFYRKIGFRDIGPVTSADGISYTPMELELHRFFGE
ncbi:MAG: GNAT family N-acetyltransferase [Butyrivibrio sp.]|nr:GNAT family N-acetyltransferase [Butyrivibrio sp.]